MSANEKHYSVPYIAAQWNLSQKTVRGLFKNEPGVVRIGKGTRKEGRQYVRRYFRVSIPESVLLRVYNRMVNKAA